MSKSSQEEISRKEKERRKENSKAKSMVSNQR